MVHGVGGKDEEDELPAADSCALTDSESDEDDGNEIMFQKKKSRLFGKVSFLSSFCLAQFSINNVLNRSNIVRSFAILQWQLSVLTRRFARKQCVVA